MSKDDVYRLHRIMGGATISGPTLAAELIRYHKMHEASLVRYARVIQERDGLAREVRTLKARETPTARKYKQERDQYHDRLEIAFKRNTILNAKLKEARAWATT